MIYKKDKISYLLRNFNRVSVDIVKCSFILFPLFEHAFKYLSSFILLDTLSIFKVIMELPLVHCSITVFPNPESFSDSLYKITFKRTSIGPSILTIPMRLSRLIKTNVSIPISKDLLSFSIL